MCSSVGSLQILGGTKKLLQRRKILLPSSSPREDRCLPSSFFSGNLKVLSQGNLRGRSLHGPRSATTCWLTNTALSFRVLSLIFDSSCFYHRGTQWRCWLTNCATRRKIADSVPIGVTGIFHWHNPSGRTMVLGLTQPLREMSTRDIIWRVKDAGA